MIPFIKYISESYVRCVRRNTKKHTSTGNWQPTIAHDNGNDHSSSLATSFLIPKRNYYSCFIFVFIVRILVFVGWNLVGNLREVALNRNRLIKRRSYKLIFYNKKKISINSCWLPKVQGCDMKFFILKLKFG